MARTISTVQSELDSLHSRQGSLYREMAVTLGQSRVDRVAAVESIDGQIGRLRDELDRLEDRVSPCRSATPDRVRVQRSGRDGRYGPAMTLDDVRGELRAEILGSPIPTGRYAVVSIGGQDYRWWLSRRNRQSR